MKTLELRFDDKTVRLDVPKNGGILGRAADCDVVVDHPSISRRHAEIRPERDGVRLVDLDSTNGLWVEARRVDEATVVPDEPFVLGSVVAVLRDVVSFDSSGERPALEDRSTPRRPRREPPDDESRGTPITDEHTLDVPPASPVESPRIVPADWAARDAILETLLREGASKFGYRGAAVLVSGNGPLALRYVAGAAPPRDVAEKIGAVGDGWDRDDGSDGSVLTAATTSPDGARAVARFVFERPEAARTSSSFRPFGELLVELAVESAPWDSVDKSVRLPNVSKSRPSAYIATTPCSRAPLELARRLAADVMPVLLLGPSGAGKELLARVLHDESPRADGPYVAINCSAIPAELLEAELFGIERGVATGVDARQGRFVQASGGTLFLDEIGDLPISLQPKLLRALETSEVLPVGATHAVPIQVRVVSATNQDLPQRVRTSAFRSDLFYRLAGVRIEIPPLTDRREDILPMARQFAREAARKRDRSFLGFDMRFVHALLGYEWPGNVRELRHAIEGAVALSEGPSLQHYTLPPEIRSGADEPTGEVLLSTRVDWRTAKAAFARWYFSKLIESHDANMTEVARRAGLGRATLYRIVGELGLR